MEVYAPFALPDGEQLLYEVYMPLDRLPQAQDQIMKDVLPLALTVLVCLQLLQVPLWASLVRSIRGAEAARARLLERSATASETERRRLARFLHDDVIQNLAGVAYALDMMPTALPAQTSPAVRTALSSAGRAVGSNLGTLRGLIADLYPGRLDEVGLEAALDGLLRPLRTRGVEAVLHILQAEEPPAALATVTYNVAREAIRNADLHAGAGCVTVRVVGDGRNLRLTVVDDGRGFDAGSRSGQESAFGRAPDLVNAGHPENGHANGHANGRANGQLGERLAGQLIGRVDGRTADGHYGLRLMRDTVADFGGTLEVTSRPGAGTTIEALLPYAYD